MNQKELHELLNSVAEGRLSVEDASVRLRTAPYTDLGYAKVDHHRGLRQGVAEVVYGEGKTGAQIAGIVAEMLDNGEPRILVTRMGAEKVAVVKRLVDVRSAPFSYDESCRVAIVGELPEPDGAGSIVVACGGTSDLPVAEEAAITAEMLGNEVVRIYDVGVAGLHRLLSHADELARARVVIVVAGMEGALPSVVGGMVSCPVIAVPTSVGYGASFNGLSALLAMLNSCASGVSVVNIDNGFGAGYQASLINHLLQDGPGHAPARGSNAAAREGGGKGRTMQLYLDFTKGATRQVIVDQLREKIGESGWSAVTADAMRAGIPKRHHHGIVEVRETIAGLSVPQVVKDHLSAVYEILAAAEAQVHECEVDHTHFHEVGNGEAIFNALVICLAFVQLHPDYVLASPVQTGSGQIECAHGLMDVPAPATAAILAQGIPVCEEKLAGELCTPTSAAIIKHFVNEFRAF